MEISGNEFALLGMIDIAEMQDLVRKLPEEAWSSQFADQAPVHKDARHVMIKVDGRQEHFFGREYPAMMNYFAPGLEPLIQHLSTALGDGYLKWAHLSRHEADFGFPYHTDWFSYTLINARRMHLPIITNDKVCFAINGDKRNLKEGELWEIDNTGIHGGHNGGKTPRVHLMIDFIRAGALSPDDVQRYLANVESISRRSGLIALRPPHADEPDYNVNPVHNLEEVNHTASKGRVCNNVIIGLNYMIRDAHTGAILSMDDTIEPIPVMHGRGQIPHKLEQALAGKRVGDQVSVSLKPEEAYGHRNEQLVFDVPREQIEALILRDDRFGFPVRNGDGGEASNLKRLRNYFIAPAQKGSERDALVTSFSGTDQSTLDGNHPFAGRIVVDAQILYVRAPRPDEAKFATWGGASMGTVEQRLATLESVRTASPAGRAGTLTTTARAVPVDKHRGDIPRLDI